MALCKHLYPQKQTLKRSPMNVLHSGGMAPALATLLGYGAFLAGSFLGYGLSNFIFRTPDSMLPEVAESLRLLKIEGWPQVERRLGAWFGDQIRACPSSPLEDVSTLSERLHLEESVNE
jgi:hypothetical protein